MYHIHQIGNLFHCYVQIQDGTEQFVESTLEKAISAVIQAAKVLNGASITRYNIKYLQCDLTGTFQHSPRRVTVTEEGDMLVIRILLFL